MTGWIRREDGWHEADVTVSERGRLGAVWHDDDRWLWATGGAPDTVQTGAAGSSVEAMEACDLYLARVRTPETR